MIGAGHALGLDAACERAAALSATAREVRKDVIVVAHGGPFESPDQVQRCYDATDVDGFLAASSIERLPVETMLASVIESYRNLKLRR
jgi:predicted TIM-barrel enzyme